MENDSLYFDIFPKVVMEGEITTIKVKPLYDHKRIKHGARYQAQHTPMETRGLEGEGTRLVEIKPITKDGGFEIPLIFNGEQEHRIEIIEIVGEEKKNYCSFGIYSLKKDLHELRPYKGDMHMHSYHSDGKESPAYVTGACRRIGLDFMALTDHGQYKPSIEAQDSFKDLHVDLKVFPGEEIHPPNNEVHMINFGGSFSVNESFKNEEEKYFKEVEAIRAEENSNLSEADQYKYASCKWCFDKIQEGGGLGIYCHPYWIYGNGYNVSKPLHDYLYDKQPFDAYELIGGFHRDEAESNLLQVTYYQEQRSRGKEMPIVGVTDAHGCENGELFGWYHTIVFAPNLELESLIDGIKGLNSVAIEALPDNPVRVYGPYRLVKYALFLIREVFPSHDKLCYEEGNLMLECIKGNRQAADMLKAYKGRVERLMDNYWGKSQ